MSDNIAISITNDYPKEKYNLLIPVKTMQMPSDMFKIIVNEVQIDSNPDNGDVYVQSNKLALTKNALSKLAKAAGISIKESKPIMPSTHVTAIEMARAIGKVVPYDTRDIAHEVTVLVPEASGQYSVVIAQKEYIIENLKAEYIEQKKNHQVWENGKKRPATEKEKADAAEKQLTQFIAHSRAQCESKALNRALRQAMQIKSTYTAEELKKPFIVALVVPNLENPDFKNVMLQNYSESVKSLFAPSSNIKALAAPSVTVIDAAEPDIEDHDNDIPTVEAEIIESSSDVICEKCAAVIETIDEQWTVEAIVNYSRNKFKGKVYCPDCQKEILEAFRKAKEAGK
jgi:hypothetical protein